MTLLNLLSFLAGSFCGIVAVYLAGWLSERIRRIRRERRRVRYLTPRLISENRGQSALSNSFWTLR